MQQGRSKVWINGKLFHRPPSYGFCPHTIKYSVISLQYEPDEKVIVAQAMALLIIAALLSYYQSFKLWTSLGQRSLRQLLACVLVIVCNYSLYKLYWRFLLTAGFHSLVAVLVAWKMRAGSGDFKLPNYTV